MKAASLLAAIAVGLTAAPAALADKKSEAFIQANANSALSVLNERSLTPEQREKKFGEYMTRFANMPGIARRVIGVHARSLDASAFDRFLNAFQVYAMDNYQVYFDQFRGEAIRVTGSKDDSPQRSTVASVVKNSRTGKDTKVYWDVLLSNDGQTYKIRDVGLDLNGSILWLAQEQQAQFVSFLDRNNGDINKLIVRIGELVQELEAKKKSLHS